jgi:hypothetical protein
MFLNSFCRNPKVVFHSTSVIAQQQAARSGWGSRCCRATWPRRSGLVALLPEESIQRSYWISTRASCTSRWLRVLWDYVVELCARQAAAAPRRVQLTQR